MGSIGGRAERLRGVRAYPTVEDGLGVQQWRRKGLHTHTHTTGFRMRPSLKAAPVA